MGNKGMAQHAIERDIHAQDIAREEEREKGKVLRWKELQSE